MAIPTGILDYPDIGRLPNNITFSLVNNTTVFQSPIGGSTQTLEVPGAYWKGTVTYSNLTREQAGTLNAFLVQLRGRSGRFWFGNLSYTVRQSVTHPTTIGMLNSQSSVSVYLRSLNPTNGIVIARAGDYIAFRYRYQGSIQTQSLHMLTK